jgi:hypothetical protein
VTKAPSEQSGACSNILLESSSSMTCP